MNITRNKVRMRTATAGLAIVTALTGLAGTAQAAEEGVGRDIIVTAQRKSERLQDVPAAVTAIGGDSLATQQITAVSEALKSVPNLQVDMPYGYGGPPNFTIRGIAAADAGLNLSKPIALYIDDVIRNTPIFEIQPLFDIDRLEVLRGPQGTLYGRNATGGTIKIMTKAPEFDNTGYATAGYGSFKQIHLEGAANVQLVDDVLALRVSGYYLNNDGISKSKSPGIKNGDSADIFAFRAALRFKPSDNFDATLRFNHMHSGGRELVALAGNAENAWLPASLYSVPGWDRAGLGYFESQTDFEGHRDTQSDGVNLTMSWKPSDSYEINSVTSYDWGSFNSNYDTDGLPVGLGVSATKVRDLAQFYQELRISSDYDGPFNWQGGVNYVWDKIHYEAPYIGNYDERCVECGDWDLDPYGFFLPYDGNFGFDQRRKGVSGFLRATFQVTPDFDVFGGLRYSKDHVKGIDYFAEFDGYPLFSGVNIKDSFHNTSFEFGANYKVAPDVMFYASYKEGYRAGQLSGAASFDASQVEIIKPETVKSYEVGFKSQFLDRRVTLNVSASQTDYKNQQVVTLVTPEGFYFPLGLLTSIPASRVRALEIETSVRPIESLSLFANFGFADPKYTKDTGLVDDDGVSPLEIAGNQMVGSVKFNTNLGGKMDVAKIGGGTLSVGADATYQSKRYFSLKNLPEYAQKGYWVANASMGFDLDKISINASVKNMFNKHYSLATYQGLAYGTLLITRGAPRMVMVDATYRF